MPRQSNSICDFCGKEYYRRPSQIRLYKKGYCSIKCYAADRHLPRIKCPICHNYFKRKYKKQKYCSIKCGAIGSRGKWPTKYKDGIRHVNQRRMVYLKDKFKFESCMINGCNYNKIYEMHRLVPDKNGGKYIIGNMFAICPNHHAEITRNIIKVEKVNDYTLRIID